MSVKVHRRTREERAVRVRMDRSASGNWWLEVYEEPQKLVFECRGLGSVRECMNELDTWMSGHSRKTVKGNFPEHKPQFDVLHTRPTAEQANRHPKGRFA